MFVWYGMPGFVSRGACLYRRPASNSHIDNFWYGGDLEPRNDCPTFNCTVDAATVTEVPAQGPWPPQAQAIMAASGAPSWRR